MSALARLALIATLSAALNAAAQDDDFVPPEGRPPQGQPMTDERPPEFQRQRPPDFQSREMRGGPGGPMLDRWMDKLKNENPQEFERMTRLREEDPEAFLGEVRKKFKQELGSRLQREHPALFQAIQDIPAEDRDWLFNRMLRAGPPGPDQKGGGQPQMPGPRGPPADENDNAVRQLAQDYRTATGANEKEQIKTKIRAELDKSFDLRMASRQAEMARFEERIAEMKQNLETRAAHREAIVDKRLKELTEGENWAW